VAYSRKKFAIIKEPSNDFKYLPENIKKNILNSRHVSRQITRDYPHTEAGFLNGDVLF
jgi:hypothetical protein